MLYARVCLIGLLALSLIGLMLPSSAFLHTPSVPRAHAASRSIRLTGTYLGTSGWNGTNPGPTIVAAKGDSVSMSLLSGDGVSHTFVVDVDKSAITSTPNCSVEKCSPSFYSMTVPTSFPFTVDFGPGMYTYYCSIHLSLMFGTFMVTSPGPDYSVSSSPSSLTILRGGSSNSTVTVTSLNNFAGSVTLSSSASSPPGLTTGNFNVNPVSVPAGGTAKSNFTISVPASTPAGSYSLTVTGANSTTFSRSTVLSVTVTVPDFTIMSSSSSLNIPQGSSETTMITLTSLNGFSGVVSLTSTLSSSGPKLTFSSGSLIVPSGGSVSSTMNVSAASSANSAPVSQGSYTVTVTGTSGSLVHSTMVSLVVTSASGIANLPTLAIIGGGVAGVIAVVVATVYMLRRRTKTYLLAIV